MDQVEIELIKEKQASIKLWEMKQGMKEKWEQSIERDKFRDKIKELEAENW